MIMSFRKKRNKAQGSLEYLVIIAAVLAISAVVVYFVAGATKSQVSSTNFAKCKQAASDCASSHLLSPNDPCISCETACTVNGRDLIGITGVSAVNFCKKGEVEEIYERPAPLVHSISTLNFTNVSGTSAGITLLDKNHLLVAVNGEALEVYDISNKSSPINTLNISEISKPLRIAVSGETAFVTDEDKGLFILGFQNPSNPLIYKDFKIDGKASDLYVSGNIVYLIDSSKHKVLVIDVSNKFSPVLVNSFDYKDGTPTDVFVNGNYLFIAVSHYIEIRDLSNDKVNSPVIATVKTTDNVEQVDVFGNYLYSSEADDTLEIFDIGKIKSPRKLFSKSFASKLSDEGAWFNLFVDIHAFPNYLFISSFGKGVVIINIKNVNNPRIIDVWGNVSYSNYIDFPYIYSSRLTDGFLVGKIN